MQAPMDHAMDTQSNPLKRKRELLPLGTPPRSTTSLPSEPRSILRVNRACNTCRRQKMRCEGPDQIPCARCKNAGVECIFEKVPPTKGNIVSTPNRIAALEKQMEVMQATQNKMQNSIQEILHELRRRPTTSVSPATDTKNSLGMVHPSENYKVTTHSPYFLEAGASSSSSSRSLSTPATIIEDAQRLSSMLHPSLPPIQSLLSPFPTPAEYSFSSSPLSRAMNALDSDTFDSSVVGQTLPGSTRHSSTWPSLIAGVTPPAVDSTRSPSDQSGMSDIISAPRVEHYDGNRGNLSDNVDSVVALDMDQARAEKGIWLDARQVLREDSGSRVWNPNDHIKEFRDEDSIHIGAIERGLLTEADAQFLFDLFFERCHPRMPIFDPKTDSYKSLRHRSPFCFCCVLMVASKSQDGGDRPSVLQLALLAEAMWRAKESMFQRVKDLEVIQGILLLSAWSESTGGTSWILAGHAIRCGVDLGIHKALGKLASESNNDEDVTKVLVCSARVWCALFAFEHQLSFGIGRLTMTGSPKTVKGAREILLRHPLSNPYDMRLVYACEIMLMEYQILDSLPNADAKDPRCQQILQEGRARMDQWYSDWEALLSPIFPPEHYMRQTLAVHRCFGYMTVHMACVPRIMTTSDIDSFSGFEREVCFRAVSASRDIVEISVNKESYRDGLRYSPPCFYGGVSFVGAMVLRLGHILPGEQEYNASLVERLARVLEDVPTCRFKFSLVTLLKEFQSKKRENNTASVAIDIGAADSGSNP